MTEIQQIQAQIEKVRSNLQLAERFTRLSQNADFKAIILDHYMRDHALDCVAMLSRTTNAAQRENIQRELVCISEFQLWLQSCEQQFSNLGETLAMLQHELDLAVAEELTGDDE